MLYLLAIFLMFIKCVSSYLISNVSLYFFIVHVLGDVACFIFIVITHIQPSMKLTFNEEMLLLTHTIVYVN